MLFNYPVHVYLLNFRTLPSVASVILFAACAGVGGVGGAGGGGGEWGKEGHTVCVPKAHLPEARPVFWGPTWEPSLWGGEGRDWNPYCLLFLAISVTLSS